MYIGGAPPIRASPNPKVNTSIIQNAGELLGDPTTKLADGGNRRAQALVGM